MPSHPPFWIKNALRVKFQPKIPLPLTEADVAKIIFKISCVGIIIIGPHVIRPNFILNHIHQSKSISKRSYFFFLHLSSIKLFGGFYKILSNSFGKFKSLKKGYKKFYISSFSRKKY